MILKTCGPQHLTGTKYKPRFVQTTTKSLSQSEARQPGPPVVRSTPDTLVACDDLIHNRKSFKQQARMHVATLIQRTTSSAFEVKSIANHRYTVLLSYISAYFICYVDMGKKTRNVRGHVTTNIPRGAFCLTLRWPPFRTFPRVGRMLGFIITLFLFLMLFYTQPVKPPENSYLSVTGFLISFVLF